MKRDMDLIRLLLLEAEGEEIDLTGYTEEQVGRHIQLLDEAGFVVATVIETRTLGSVSPEIVSASVHRLTWEGHDFLATIKNETVWRETKKSMVEKGADVSIAILKALATKITMDMFGLS
jgi:hypothetical protein